LSLEKSHMCHITSSLSQYVLKMSPSSTNATAYMLKPLAISTVNNHVTQSSPLIVDTSFQFVDVQDLGTIDSLLISVKIVANFQ